MDDLTLIWLIMVVAFVHMFANAYFVRWVLWRNEALSKLLVWYHQTTNSKDEEE